MRKKRIDEAAAQFAVSVRDGHMTLNDAYLLLYGHVSLNIFELAGLAKAIACFA